MEEHLDRKALHAMHSDREKDFRIAGLIYESACYQVEVNKLSQKILELETEILRLEKEIEKRITN